MATGVINTELYNLLVLNFRQNKYEKVYEILDRINKQYPNNKDAIYLKLLCFIEKGKFNEALSLVNHNQYLKNMKYEKAYCQYRTNHCKEALNIVSSFKETAIRDKEFLSQIHYKLENYDKCYELYLELIKSTQDDYDDERLTNLLACLPYLKDQALAETFENEDAIRSSCDIYFNLAIIHLSNGRNEAAKKNLKRAEGICRKLYSDEDQAKELEKEMINIEAQMAYIDQVEGDDKKALDVYGSILNKLTDESSSALQVVVINNKYVIDQADQADYKKSIKKMADQNVASKLSTAQLQDLTFNQAIFAFRTNQIDLCRNMMKNYQQRFPSASFQLIFLTVAILCKEKNYDEALNVVEGYRSKGDQKDNARIGTLLKVHVLSLKGEYQKMIEALKQLPDLYTYPILFDYISSLYQKMGATGQIGSLYVEWLNNYKSQKGANPLYKVIVEKLAHYLINLPSASNSTYASSRAIVSQAIPLLEEYSKTHPDDIQFRVLLMKMFTKYDARRAKEICDKISRDSGYEDDSSDTTPTTDTEISLEDVDNDIRNIKLFGKFKSKAPKTRAAVDTRPANQDVLVSQSATSSRRNKNCLARRRQRLSTKRTTELRLKKPEAFQPNSASLLDPERWLPKHRSGRANHYAYRKRTAQHKHKGGASSNDPGRGTQGAIISNDDNLNQSTASASSVQTGAQNVTSSSNQTKSQLASLNKKKKKKGGRW